MAATRLGRCSLEVEFVDSRNMDRVLIETHWDLPLPREGDVVELHCGEASRWVVEELDWVFETVSQDQHEEVPVKKLKVMVIPEDLAHRGEGRPVDPVCICGHPKSVHAPARCLGNASTCDCRGFAARE